MSTLQELLQKADSYKQKISSAHPLEKEELKSLDNYFRISFTYSSNALEGNTLTISETKILFEDGITVDGHPLNLMNAGYGVVSIPPYGEMTISMPYLLPGN